jgi:hypothetical protein
MIEFADKVVPGSSMSMVIGVRPFATSDSIGIMVAIERQQVAGFRNPILEIRQ